jgi:hypothetical protein
MTKLNPPSAADPAMVQLYKVGAKGRLSTPALRCLLYR